MWNHLITTSTLRDASIFIGAYLTLQAVANGFRSEPPEAFKSYPLLVGHGFGPVLEGLACMATPDKLKALLDTIEKFLAVCTEGNVRRDGFRANRLLQQSLDTVKDILRVIKASEHHRDAMDAISYETDNLPQFETMMTDALRNMLLDGTHKQH